MTTITSLELCTVPLTEEGVERYKISDPIDNHLTTILLFPDDLNCSVGRIFNTVKIPVSWITVNSANYIKATMEFNNPSGSSLEIRGWIDSIDPLSDTENFAQVEVKWHFDYWEMYKSLVTFGYGHIKRRPYNGISDTPIQNYPVRYYKLGDTDISLIDTVKLDWREIWWVIISLNRTENGHTSTITLASPILMNPTLLSQVCYYRIHDSNDNTDKTVTGPSLANIYTGGLDEWLADNLQVTPDAVNGVWLSPTSPVGADSGTGSGTSGDPFVPSTVYGSPYVNGGSGMYPVFSSSFTPKSVTKTFTAITSTEEKRYILTSTDGIRTLELPYGFAVDSVTTTLIVEPDGPYFEISFKDSSYGNLEGMTVNVPLTSLPMNSNSYSSYVYSGQREYDKDMRVVQSNTNAWKTSSGGAAGGAMMGAFGPAGAAVGILGGLAGGLIGYGVEMLYTNDEEQRFEDRLAANQPSSLILSSNSLLAIARRYGFRIKDIAPDSYSLGLITNTRNNQGVSVDEILSSCDTQVRTTAPTGYYNIQNLIITGSVPKEAKDYIKKKFASGVKLL